MIGYRENRNNNEEAAEKKEEEAEVKVIQKQVRFELDRIEDVRYDWKEFKE